MDSKKDIEQYQTKGHPIEEVFLGNNTGLIFILKKSERLTGALYTITSRMPKDEPITHSIKGRSLDFMSFISRSVVSQGQWSFEIGRSVKEMIVEIVSLLEVAALSGFVSPMNKEIFLQEFNGLARAVEEEFSKINSVFSRGDIGALYPSNFSHNVHVQTSQSSKVKDGYKGHDVKKEISSVKFGSHFTDKKEGDFFDKRHSRRDDIVAVFKKENRFLSVKDINIYFKDYSEKTIQRELLSLVKEGVLKKEGERRWSRYILV